MISGQSDLFEEAAARKGQQFREEHEPLAARMRPKTIEDFIGQEEILGPDSILRRDLENGRCSSMILWGPPGVNAKKKK